MKFRKKIIFITILALLSIALPASAALPQLVPPCATGTTVPPLSCFLTLLGNVSKWILGISGSLALLMFVYGGFMMVASGGSSDKVTKGKTILTQAVIGLIIIFGAYFAVDFLTKALGFQESKFKIQKEATTSTSSGSLKDASKVGEKPVSKLEYSCYCIAKVLEKPVGGGPTQSSTKEYYKSSYATQSECDSNCKSGCSAYSSYACKKM